MSCVDVLICLGTFFKHVCEIMNQAGMRYISHGHKSHKCRLYSMQSRQTRIHFSVCV